MIKQSKNILSLAALGLFTGCAQMHTGNYKDVSEKNLSAGDEMDAIKQNTVDEILSGATVDDFFVDINPVKVKAKDSKNLPDFLPETLSLYSAVPLSEAELSQLLYAEYGLRLNFNRVLSPSKPDDESKTPPEQPVEVAGTLSLANVMENAGAQKDSEPSSDNFDPSHDMYGLFGSNMKKDSSDTRISSIDYDGTLVGFFDWLALDRKLSWKYDDDNDVFVLFDLDTVVFEILDNTDTYKYESTIDTASESNAGSQNGASSSSSSTSQKVTMEEDSKHWEDLQEMIKQMLSPNGKAAFDLKNGRVAVTDNQQSLAKIGRIIDQINSASGSQVLLDLTYVKVSLDESSEIGTHLTASDIVAGSVTGDITTGGSVEAFSNIFNINFSKAGVTAMLGSLSRFGTISYRYDAPILTMNNQLSPFQSVEEEHYISEVEVETDDDGAKTINPKKAVNKTGLTSTWVNRIVNDKVLVKGKINLVENLMMTEKPELNSIILPKNALDSHDLKAVIKNGQTRVVSIQEITRKSSESSGPFGANSFLIGGSEKTSKRREISMVILTPYILK